MALTQEEREILDGLVYSINRMNGLTLKNYEWLMNLYGLLNIDNQELEIHKEKPEGLLEIMKKKKLEEKEEYTQLIKQHIDDQAEATKRYIDDNISKHITAINSTINDHLNMFKQAIIMLEQRIEAKDEQKRLSDSFAKRLMNSFKK